jgi:hypothetical protein
MNRELIDDMRWKAQESLPLVRKQYQSEVGFPSGNMLTRGGGSGADPEAGGTEGIKAP